jgi:hypothetical protein
MGSCVLSVPGFFVDACVLGEWVVLLPFAGCFLHYKTAKSLQALCVVQGFVGTQLMAICIDSFACSVSRKAAKKRFLPYRSAA